MRRKRQLTASQCNKRDRLLAEFLQHHKGRANVVGRTEIAEFLTANGYEQKATTTNMLVRTVMYDRRLPICEINGRGYYWAESKSDFEDTINDLEKRIASMREHIEFLKSFMYE